MNVDELAATCPVDLGRSEPVQITQEMVDTHAATTGDAQWIHNDPERARRDSPFGGPIAQGFLLSALLTRLSSGFSFPTLGSVAMLVNYGFDRMRFLSPVPVDSAVSLHGTLAEVRPKGDGSAVLVIDVELQVDDGGSDGGGPDGAGPDGGARPAMAARWLFLAVAG